MGIDLREKREECAPPLGHVWRSSNGHSSSTQRVSMRYARGLSSQTRKTGQVNIFITTRSSGLMVQPYLRLGQTNKIDTSIDCERLFRCYTDDISDEASPGHVNEFNVNFLISLGEHKRTRVDVP